MACSKFPKKFIAALLPPAFWLGAWQLGAFLVELHVEGRGNELLLPYPATVLSALVRLAQDPAFWGTALTSLLRIAAGMAAGVALGSALAAPHAGRPPLSLRDISPALRGNRPHTPTAGFLGGGSKLIESQ